MKNRHPAFNIILNNATDKQKVQQLEKLFQKQQPKLSELKADEGQTLLHAACKKSGKELLEWLLGKEPSLIDSKDNHGVNVYCTGLESNNQQAIEFFAKHSAFTSLLAGIDSRGFTTNAYAAWSGNVDLLQQNIKQLGKSDLNNKDQIGTINTFLLRCAKEGFFPMFQLLVTEFKVDPNNAFDKEGWAAIHHAAYQGHIQLVAYLLEICKVDANLVIKNQDAETPCLLAARGGKLDVLKKLVEHKANVHYFKNDGFNALHAAAENGHLPIISYLIEKCAMSVDVESKNDWGSTPCHQAVCTGKLDALKLLIEQYKAKIHYFNKKGCHAIHIAAEKSHPEIISYLVKSCNTDVDLQMKNLQKHTALTFAKALGQLQSIKILNELIKIKKLEEKKANKMAQNKRRKERKKAKLNLEQKQNSSEKKPVENIDKSSPVDDSSDDEVIEAPLPIEPRSILAQMPVVDDDNEGFAKVVNKKKSKQKEEKSAPANANTSTMFPLLKSQLPENVPANASTSVIFPIPPLYQAKDLPSSSEGQQEGLAESKKPSECNSTLFSEPWYKKILKPACDFLKEKIPAIDTTTCQIDGLQQYLLIHLTVKQANELGLKGIVIEECNQPALNFNAKIHIQQLLNQAILEVDEPGASLSASF